MKRDGWVTIPLVGMVWLWMLTLEVHDWAAVRWDGSLHTWLTVIGLPLDIILAIWISRLVIRARRDLP